MSDIVTDVGAGWTRTAKSGNAYVSISLKMRDLWKALGFDPDVFPKDFPEKISLSMFENSKKTEEKQPDFRFVYFEKPIK